MSITTEQQHNHHHSLLNWLTHVTHKHNRHHHDNSIKPHFQLPVIKQEKEITPDNQPLTCCTTVKHSTNDSDSSLHHHISLFHHHPPFHTKKHYHYHDDNSSDEQHQCKCCERRPSSVNDADDEMSSILSVKTEKMNNTITTTSTTTTSTYTNNSKEEHRKSVLSVESNDSSFSTVNNGDATQKGKQREKSIYALPDDIKDPSEGYKLLKQDGGLIDYDSSGFEADDEDSSEITKVTYNSTKVIIKNDLVKLALNGLFHSPIHHEPKRQVLHVGCGDGSWCVNVAQLYPDWLVIGMDDKTGGPIQDHRKVPRNFKYVRCYYDILKTMQDMPDDSFDLIYGRFLIYSYGEEDYIKLISECKRICKTGGFVELAELDMTIYGNPLPGSVTRVVNANVFRAMEERGLSPVLAPKLSNILLKAFSVKDQNSNTTFDTGYTSMPLGLWGGRMGVLFRDDINELFQVLELYTELHYEEKYENEDDTDDKSDQNSVISHSIEAMDEELEVRKAFMNLHTTFIQKMVE
ncbi:hypothetical protein K501DRAFT_250359 [Backusella circina FSU 941]|nr:hypothetical protein K501DRAFT_250359 [Backusella circina FSU 941]